MKCVLILLFLFALMIDPIHGAEVSVSPDARTLAFMLAGKVCVTPAGASFSFSSDGHYAYSGLWTSHGHYSVQAGVIFVMLDHGLGRRFDVVVKDGVLYMNNIALLCQSQ